MAWMSNNIQVFCTDVMTYPCLNQMLVKRIFVSKRAPVSRERIKFKHRFYVFSIIGLILGLRPANERHRYKVMLSLIGWAPT